MQLNDCGDKTGISSQILTWPCYEHQKKISYISRSNKR